MFYLLDYPCYVIYVFRIITLFNKYKFKLNNDHSSIKISQKLTLFLNRNILQFKNKLDQWSSICYNNL